MSQHLTGQYIVLWTFCNIEISYTIFIIYIEDNAVYTIYMITSNQNINVRMFAPSISQ